MLENNFTSHNNIPNFNTLSIFDPQKNINNSYSSLLIKQQFIMQMNMVFMKEEFKSIKV